MGVIKNKIIPIDQSSLHHKDRKDTCCCHKVLCESATCYKIISLILVALLATSMFALAWTINIHMRASLHNAETDAVPRNQDFCNNCMSCLQNITGQDLETQCYAENGNLLQVCASQFLGLYANAPSEDELPLCHSECSLCVDGIREHELVNGNITYGTAWELFYPSWFALDSQSADSSRKRRMAIADGDSCCSTLREERALGRRMSIGGVMWYPVWFFSWHAYSKYQYQYYDVITCGNNFVTCGESTDRECRVKLLSKSVLMTAIPPHRRYGHSYVLLTHPNSITKFHSVNLDGYCRCVT